MARQELLTEFAARRYRELVFGPEIEFPLSPDSAGPTFESAGIKSSGYRDVVEGEWGGPRRGRTHLTLDESVGMEFIPSSPVHEEEVVGWYTDTIDEVESILGRAHEPVGDMAPGEGSTAGLHFHISPLMQDEAEALYRFSTKPWMKVFVCSTLTNRPNENLRVFRGGRYCRFHGSIGGSYGVVKERNGDRHYEWRLPEPMTTEHFGLVVEFLRKLVYDSSEEAETYARNLVDNGDERLTAVQRAQRVGLTLDEVLSDFTITRAPVSETAEFFRRVRDSPEMPYIYRLTSDDGVYYASRSYTSAGSYTDDETGITIEPGDVLHARTLDEVTDQPIIDAVHDAFESNIHTGDVPDEMETDATDLLREVMA